MPVTLAIAAVIALDAGLDDAGTVRLRQRVPILGRMRVERERRRGDGLRRSWRGQMPGDCLTNHRAECFFVHTSL